MFNNFNIPAKSRLSLCLIGPGNSGDLITVAYSLGFRGNDQYGYGLQGARKFRHILGETPIRTEKTLELEDHEFTFYLNSHCTSSHDIRLVNFGLHNFDAVVFYYNENNIRSLNEVKEQITKIKKHSSHKPLYLIGLKARIFDAENLSGQACELATKHNIEYLGSFAFVDSEIQRVINNVMLDAFRVINPEAYNQNPEACRKAIAIYNDVEDVPFRSLFQLPSSVHPWSPQIVSENIANGFSSQTSLIALTLYLYNCVTKGLMMPEQASNLSYIQRINLSSKHIQELIAQNKLTVTQVLGFKNLYLARLLEEEKIQEFLRDNVISLEQIVNITIEQFEIVTAILNEYPNALMMAIAIGAEEKAKELIEKDADIYVHPMDDDADKQLELDFETEAMFCRESVECFSFIRSVLSLALKLKQDDVVVALRNHPNGIMRERIKFQLAIACYGDAVHNSSEQLQYLKDQDADFNSAILWAAINENAEAIEALQPYSTITIPEDFIENEKYKEILEVLFAAGIKPSKYIFNAYLYCIEDVKYCAMLCNECDSTDEFSVIFFARGIIGMIANMQNVSAEVIKSCMEKYITAYIVLICRSLDSETKYSAKPDNIEISHEVTEFSERVQKLFECYGKLLPHNGFFKTFRESGASNSFTKTPDIAAARIAYTAIGETQPSHPDVNKLVYKVLGR